MHSTPQAAAAAAAALDGSEQQEQQAEAPPTAADDEVKRLKPWFLFMLVLQLICMGLRWHFGDAHGALLMFSVCAVGALSLSVGPQGTNGIDGVYGGYFGLMAFVSGLLDLNLAVEHLIWIEWKHWRREELAKGDLSALARPSLFMACSIVQLVSAFIAYLVYRDSEAFDDFGVEPHETMPLFASHEHHRIYSAALRHGERPTTTRQAAGGDLMKPFGGTAHKLP